MSDGVADALALSRVVGDRLGHEVIEVARVGGHNSRVYRVACASGEACAVKLYVPGRPGDRDRLKAEFDGLTFLWENGVRCVPRPLLAMSELNLAVYEFVAGTPVAGGSVKREDVDEAIDFLGALEALKQRAGAVSLPPAAEACFSLQAIVDSIESRLHRLQRVEAEGRAGGEFGTFVAGALPSALRVVTEWSATQAQAADLGFDTPIDGAARTLSPSDFGFHNALRRDGRLTFLDFEYFGWDDPAKMITDFLLHPAMELSENLKRQFVGGVLRRLSGHRRLPQRVEIVYPLFGLKWCVILLNEFLPEHLARRGFIEDGTLDVRRLQAQQMGKARAMLDRVMNGYERFAYRD